MAIPQTVRELVRCPLVAWPDTGVGGFAWPDVSILRVALPGSAEPRRGRTDGSGRGRRLAVAGGDILLRRCLLTEPAPRTPDAEDAQEERAEHDLTAQHQ